MVPVVIALFSEDIREEKNGQDTVVGVLPSNLNVDAIPAMLPKLAVYCRIQFPNNVDDFEAEIFLTIPRSDKLLMQKIDKKLIAQAKRESVERSLPIASVIVRGIMSPFPIQEAGILTIIFKSGTQEIVCGALGVNAIALPQLS